MRRETSTTKVELVETQNIALSLNRLMSVPTYSSHRWKRALYHALLMTDAAGNDAARKIREALELP